METGTGHHSRAKCLISLMANSNSWLSAGWEAWKRRHGDTQTGRCAKSSKSGVTPLPNGARASGLDAAFFHLYGVAQDDVDYIMETFPIVKRKHEEKYGDFRTKLLILDTYDPMQNAIGGGEPYQTILDPPHRSERSPYPQWTLMG